MLRSLMLSSSKPPLDGVSAVAADSTLWTPEMFETAVAMKAWPQFVRAVDHARMARFEALRDAEADRLSLTLDMTPEGFVLEWHRRGRKSAIPLAAWEHAYQRAGLIERAQRMGYISIGRDVACTITLEPRGGVLVQQVLD